MIASAHFYSYYNLLCGWWLGCGGSLFGLFMNSEMQWAVYKCHHPSQLLLRPLPVKVIQEMPLLNKLLLAANTFYILQRYIRVGLLHGRDCPLSVASAEKSSCLLVRETAWCDHFHYLWLVSGFDAHWTEKKTGDREVQKWMMTEIHFY